MLTTDEMSRICLEEMLDKPRTPDDTPERVDFRKGIVANIADAKSKGYMLEIPDEWPNLDGKSDEVLKRA